MVLQAITTTKTSILWNGEANSVAIRGTFSDDKAQWWQESIPLMRTADEAQYSVTLALRPGRYEFKYVLNGSDWCIRTDCYDCVCDGSGNTNNVIVVEANETADGETKQRIAKAPSIQGPQKERSERNLECQGLLRSLEADSYKTDYGYSSIECHAHADVNSSNSGNLSDRDSDRTTAFSPPNHVSSGSSLLQRSGMGDDEHSGQRRTDRSAWQYITSTAIVTSALVLFGAVFLFFSAAY